MEQRDLFRVGLVGFLALLALWRILASGSSSEGPTPEEALMLRSSSPVRIRLPGSPSVKAKSFSRWRCVGDMETIGAVPNRACVFERVCYHPNLTDFTFHARPGEARPKICTA